MDVKKGGKLVVTTGSAKPSRIQQSCAQEKGVHRDIDVVRGRHVPPHPTNKRYKLTHLFF